MSQRLGMAPLVAQHVGHQGVRAAEAGIAGEDPLDAARRVVELIGEEMDSAEQHQGVAILRLRLQEPGERGLSRVVVTQLVSGDTEVEPRSGELGLEDQRLAEAEAGVGVPAMLGKRATEVDVRGGERGRKRDGLPVAGNRLLLRGGSPIPPGELPRIFEPLVRGSSAQYPKHNRPGSIGLGLYIAREVARSHGGTIDATSTMEAGTAFTVRLPRHSPVKSAQPILDEKHVQTM